MTTCLSEIIFPGGNLLHLWEFTHSSSRSAERLPNRSFCQWFSQTVSKWGRKKKGLKLCRLNLQWHELSKGKWQRVPKNGWLRPRWGLQCFIWVHRLSAPNVWLSKKSSLSHTHTRIYYIYISIFQKSFNFPEISSDVIWDIWCQPYQGVILTAGVTLCLNPFKLTYREISEMITPRIFTPFNHVKQNKKTNLFFLKLLLYMISGAKL